MMMGVLGGGHSVMDALRAWRPGPVAASLGLDQIPGYWARPSSSWAMVAGKTCPRGPPHTR